MQLSSATLGVPILRAEGPDKVTGRALYTGDVKIDGALVGRILRSPYAHARICRVNTSRARSIPGVRAVVTGEDVRGCYVGKVLRDMPVLCWDRVRFVGDRVAAVAADTREAADAAISAIEVEYEELPAVFDPVQAMQPSAPLLHDNVAAYDGPPVSRLATDVHNGVTRLAWTKGNPEIGFREADLVLEHTFRVPIRHQGYIEPHVNTVAIGDDGRIQLWTTCKAPFRARIQLAAAIGVPEERIRVNVVSVGGDFGGKGDAVDAPIAYFLAHAAGRPVTIALSYGEELTASNPTHATVITVRSGVSRDGRILARTFLAVHGSGAYGALKPNAALSSWHYVGGAYRIPNASFEFLQVYTNVVPGGYFRAPGGHQYAFAIESHTDILARELGIDPADFRLMNIIDEGEEDAVGNRMRGIKARAVLEAALGPARWKDPRPTASSGRGVAIFGRQIGGGAGGAILTAAPDGSVTVVSPTVDQGTGTHTIERQMVAHELGIPVDRVRVVVGDTDVAPFDEGPRASRVTYTEGHAVLDACSRLRDRLAPEAARLLVCDPGEVEYRDGAFHSRNEQVPLAEVVDRVGNGQPVSITVEVDAAPVEDVSYFCAQVADVDVDRETGQVQVRRLVTAHDVGTILNPITHQGQIDGGVATGIGLALTEELVLDGGRITNGNLGDYKLPTVCDMPPLVTVLVPSPGGTGPYEAKAIGEFSNNPPPAAIANAVADAVGARLFELPVTSERVYNLLRDQP